MVLAIVFQTAQSFILSKEPLPENIQALVDEQEAKAVSADRGALAFEPGSRKAASKDGSQAKGSAKSNRSTGNK